MRDVTLLTRKPLQYGEVHNVILDAFRDYKVVVDDPKEFEGRIWISKGPSKIDIIFTPAYLASEHQDEFDESELSKVPFDPYFTTVLFRAGASIKRLISCLEKAGIEIWVENEGSCIVPSACFEPGPDNINTSN